MAILRLKLEETVNGALERLEKEPEVHGVSGDWRNPTALKFQRIKQQLDSILLLPQVKSIEEELVKRFITLEKEINGDILKDDEKFAGIVGKLEQICKNTETVKQLLSSVELGQPNNNAINTSSSGNPPPPSLGQSSEQVQPRRASEEWSRLIIEDTLFKSQTIQSLRQSFSSLGYTSQLCLLTFSIFPENCEIKKRLIIYWWIAEGLVSPNKYGDTGEDIGNTIFQQLINGKWINAVCGKTYPIMGNCSVHPWIRHMLISLAIQAKLFDFDTNGRPSNGQQRHFIYSKRDLRNVGDGNVTVFNMNQNDLSFPADWVSKLKTVVALQLGRWRNLPKQHNEIKDKESLKGVMAKQHHIEMDEESLKGLRGLKRLRYLSLRGISRIFTLPHSVTQLVSLEILDLRACHNLEKLPPDISSLRNLTHLDISECYLLEKMPNGLEKLTKLQVLKGFVVGQSGKGCSCKISDLTSFRKLRKLSIYIRTKAAVEEQEFNKLVQIRSLRNLTISWGAFSSSQNLDPVVKSFVLPPRLNKLDLRCIPADTLPEWVDLKKLAALEKLYIRGGQLKSFELGDFKKSNIKILRLKYLKGLFVIKEQMKTGFPNAVLIEATECESDAIFWNKDEDENVGTKEINMDFVL